MSRRSVASVVSALALGMVASLGIAAPAQALIPLQWAWNDFDDDGRADVVAVLPDGTARVYRGDGAGGFLGYRSLGSGFKAFDILTFAGDIDDDGNDDLLGRNAATGALWVFRGDGAGGLVPGGYVQISTGWGRFEELTVVSLGDGDDHGDLYALDRTTGQVFLYPGRSGYRFGSARLVATGATTWDQMTAMGDTNGDGVGEIVIRDTATGRLISLGIGWDGTLRKAYNRVVGTGWGSFTAVFSPTEFTSDGRPDLLARTADGRLFLYRGKADGTFAKGTLAGTGWQSLRLG